MLRSPPPVPMWQSCSMVIHMPTFHCAVMTAPTSHCPLVIAYRSTLEKVTTESWRKSISLIWRKMWQRDGCISRLLLVAPLVEGEVDRPEGRAANTVLFGMLVVANAAGHAKSGSETVFTAGNFQRTLVSRFQG